MDFSGIESEINHYWLSRESSNQSRDKMIVENFNNFILRTQCPKRRAIQYNFPRTRNRLLGGGTKSNGETKNNVDSNTLRSSSSESHHGQ